MFSSPIKKDDRAISPVVGVAFMIALIIVLSAVIGVVVLDLAGVDEEARAGVNFNEDTEEFTVTWVSEGNAEETYVKVNGSKVDGTTMKSVGDRVVLNVNKDSDISVIGVTENNKHTLIRTTNAARDSLSSGTTPVVVSGGSSAGTLSGVVSFNPPAEGVTVTALDASGNQIDSATTNKKGEFTINDEADSYRLNGYELNTEVKEGTEINISEGDVDTTDGTVEVLMNRTGSGAYNVDSASDLYAIRYSLSEDYVLTRDIDTSHATSWNSGDGFKPIQIGTDSFKGNFNGNYHTISNLEIYTQDYYSGLFGTIDTSGSVTNVSVTNVDVTGQKSNSDTRGGLAGTNNGTIKNAHTTGTVSGNYTNLGGLVGVNNGEITNASSTVTVDGYDKNTIGGLVGANSGGTIKDSSASGDVNGNRNIGGLVGGGSGTITNSTASGDVTGYRQIGGLSGYSKDYINNSSASGSVIGDGSVGGLVGANTENEINNSYATGDVTIDDSSEAGGLVGSNGVVSETPTINNSYATGDVTGVTGATYIGGLVGNNRGTTLNSNASGSVSGSGDDVEVGGLVGYNNGQFDGIINNSSASGSVSGNVTGGLVGNNYGSIDKSYATGSVSGKENVGGIVGFNSNGLYGEGNINNSYATGSVSGNSQVGGIVGKNSGSLDTLYWDTQSTGQSEGVPGGSSKTTGLITSEMTGVSAESNMSDFDFTNDWKTQPSDYPEQRDEAGSYIFYKTNNDWEQGKWSYNSNSVTIENDILKINNTEQYGRPQRYQLNKTIDVSGTNTIDVTTVVTDSGNTKDGSTNSEVRITIYDAADSGRTVASGDGASTDTVTYDVSGVDEIEIQLGHNSQGAWFHMDSIEVTNG